MANKNPTPPPEEYRFKPGQSGNPGGRPKNPLKDFQRKLFASMTDEEKLDFLKGISADLRWRMAEGNPTEEITGADGKDLIPDTEERKKLKEAAHEALRRI